MTAIEEQLPISETDGNVVFQVQTWPKQKPPVPDDHPSRAIAYASTYPPLGQVTVLEPESARTFTVCLEVAPVPEKEASNNDQTGWEVILCYSEGGAATKEIPLQYHTLAKSPWPVSLQDRKNDAAPAMSSSYFTANLPPTSVPIDFHIKFRKVAGLRSDATPTDFITVMDHQGTAPGRLLIASASASSSDLGDFIKDLNPVLSVVHHSSQTPGTSIWSVDVPARPAEHPADQLTRLGLPWGHTEGGFSRWFALDRIWTPWLGPKHGKSHFDLNKEAIMCAFLGATGKHLVLLAISGIDAVLTTFKADKAGNVIICVENDNPTTATGKILVGLGDTFEAANSCVMHHARELVTAAETVTGEMQAEIQALQEGERKDSAKLWAENWYDGLTYCTWNALGQRLTEDKIIKCVEALAENNINVTNFIIDDNWQSIDYRGDGQFQYGMIEFEAEKKSFPKGLKHTVDLIRKKHSSIQHVAVWHALLGYWGGISAGGKIAKEYKTVQVVRKDERRRDFPMGGETTVVAKEDVNRFYNDFYSFLSSCGVDAVKTDAQFMIDLIVSPKDRCDLITAYQDAWTISTLRHFGIKAISCMSQIPQILFHSQLPRNKPPFLVRNSDDFFPGIKTSHAWHIFTNAHNALFTQHLNIIPDWDMFQTSHDYGGFHAAARCVSGGPIYITDVPGDHDFDLIDQMTGPTIHGKTVIFRPEVLGKALDQYNGYDDDKLLLIGTYHGPAGTGTGMIGFFNITQRPLTELIPLSKFPGVQEAQYYVVRSHKSGLFSKPLQVWSKHPGQAGDKSTTLLRISLEIRGYDILSAFPLRGFLVNDSTLWIANLGLIGKMAGPAAITSNTMTKLENGHIVVETKLKALGTLGLYFSGLLNTSYKDCMLITILGNVVPGHTVEINKYDPMVLEIDVLNAWKELKLTPGWSNEIEVKISISTMKLSGGLMPGGL